MRGHFTCDDAKSSSLNLTSSTLIISLSVHLATAPAMASDLTRDWLKNVLRPYPSHERILGEVMAVLAAHRTLAVKTDAFSMSPLPLLARHTLEKQLPSLYLA